MWLQTTTGCWWKACTCTHCWYFQSSPSRGFSAFISALAGVSWFSVCPPVPALAEEQLENLCACANTSQFKSCTLHSIFVPNPLPLGWRVWAQLLDAYGTEVVGHCRNSPNQWQTTFPASQDKLRMGDSSWVWTFLDCPASPPESFSLHLKTC